MRQTIPLGLIEYETTTPVPNQVIELRDTLGNREIIWVESVTDRQMTVYRRQAGTDYLKLGRSGRTTLIGYALPGAFPEKKEKSHANGQ